MKAIATAAMFALILLFAGMFMALMLFASKASWIMEGIPIAPAKSELLMRLCVLFLSTAAVLTVIVVRSLAKIRRVASDLEPNVERDGDIKH